MFAPHVVLFEGCLTSLQKNVVLYKYPLSPNFEFIFPKGNEEESLHEGDIKLSLNQLLALELFGDPTAPVLGARGITNNQNLLWDTLVVPYNISSELGKPVL